MSEVQRNSPIIDHGDLWSERQIGGVKVAKEKTRRLGGDSYVQLVICQNLKLVQSLILYLAGRSSRTLPFMQEVLRAERLLPD
uniref:Uncharacterized protein n=1 Tax=Pyricularia oryzae (strain P131) TaxID=1143193 RepID=L7J5K6_PYRO1